jgi:DNA-binding transcriptional MocR family regulator
LAPEGLAARCRAAPVVSIGSLSKVAWGGLRIGWIRAPHALAERIVRARHASDLGAAVPSQLLALRLLPELDTIVTARRAYLRRRADDAVALLAGALPTWSVASPRGGLAVWARLPLADSGPLTQLAHRHGVRVAPGAAAAPLGGPDPHVRLCVDRPEAQLAEGVRRLAAAWAELGARGRVVLG